MTPSQSIKTGSFLAISAYLDFPFDFFRFRVYNGNMLTNDCKTLKLSEIVRVKSFLQDMAQGLIQDRAHPDDPELRIFSYTKKTQFGGLWTSESKLARGLILHVPDGDFYRATVRGRGLPKFFTVSQATEGDWGRVKLVDDDENVTVNEAPVIPWTMPAVVSEKVNGALGLGYIDPSGEFRISTKGSFDSLESRSANRTLDRKYSHMEELLSGNDFLDSYTPLFEIITPERPHPVDYGDFEGLIYLGYITNGTGKWHPADGYHLFEDPELGFEGAKQLVFATLMEAVEAPYELNTEGFVVTVVDGGPEDIYKVKPVEYLQLRRLFYALQASEIKEYLMESKFWEKVSEIEAASQIDLSAFVGNIELSPQLQTMLEGRRSMIYSELVVPTQLLVKAAVFEATDWSVYGGVPHTKGDFARHIAATIPKNFQSIYFQVFDVLGGGDSDRIYQAAFKKVLSRSGVKIDD